MTDSRIIGEYTGSEKGPLLICLAGVHGNEPAGVEALKYMFKLLENEPHINPDFKFKGRFIGVLGNTKAFAKKTRFINKDMNRHLSKEHVDKIKNLPLNELDAEDKEILEVLALIDKEIEEYQPEKMIVLDIHTTTATGGIFAIATDDPESVRIAMELHAPVIKGMLKGIKGTSLHYFNNNRYQPETIAICFEAGQHQDPTSAKVAVAALTNCMRTIGCLDPKDVENKHDAILLRYGESLPKIVQLIHRHPVKETDGFKMKPGYENFNRVKKNELLAFDVNGEIRSLDDALILMPLYQKKGEDGFFLIKEIRNLSVTK